MANPLHYHIADHRESPALDFRIHPFTLFVGIRPVHLDLLAVIHPEGRQPAVVYKRVGGRKVDDP